MKIPELLAPVGSKEALKAAIQNGADAVYLGGTMFSARQYANNFDRDELREAFDYAHIRGVKVYVTANTLLNDNEFREALDYLQFLYENGADAVIIQDLGVVRIVEKLLPGLPLHASTQMTIHNSSGVEVLKKHHFTRVVLARELSLGEIAEIRKKTGTEIEVFVHGALCVSYSGQCLMSSMIGGRSGNRGRCAQPCRMEYKLVDNNGQELVNQQEVGSHLLSPRDLNMLKHIPELAQAGVDSLKIEGRMKRPEYVATVTRIYREALDRYKDSPSHYSISDKEIKELGQIFNRGFTTGYFFGKQGRDMMSYKRPNNRGLRLGRVSKTNRAERMVEIMLEDVLRKGDGVEFWVTEGGRKGSVVNRIELDGRLVEEASPGEKVWIEAEGRIRPGDRIFKTHDIELISRAEASYTSPREIKKIPLHFEVTARIGEPFTIAVQDPEGRKFSHTSDFLGQEALKKPLTTDALGQQIDRLGNTPYSIGVLEAHVDENVMIPVSVINDTRRTAIEGLSELRSRVKIPKVNIDLDLKASMLPKNLSDRYLKKPVNRLQLSVRVHNLDMLKRAAAEGADIIYFGGSHITGKKETVLAKMREAHQICSTHGASLVIATPRILREPEMQFVLPLLEYAGENGLAVLAANVGMLREAPGAGVSTVYGDYTLNIFNSNALEWVVENYGLTQVNISPELTFNQISAMSQRSKVPIEVLVEGHLPLMVTEYCPQGSLLGGLGENNKCAKACRSNAFRGFKDRLGLVFPLSQDDFCRTYVHNAKNLSMIDDLSSIHKAGISVLRVETSIEETERAAVAIRLWRQEIDRFTIDPEGYEPRPEVKAKIESLSPAGLTKGHYYRGVE